MAAISQKQLTKFIRGIGVRQIRLACGLVLFAYLVSISSTNSSALDRHLVSRTSGLNEVASCSIGVGAPSLGFDRLVGRQATSRPLDLCVGSAMTTGVHLGHWRRILPDVVSDLRAGNAPCVSLAAHCKGFGAQGDQQQGNSANRTHDHSRHSRI
jgi:hypothetical protein